MKSFIGVDIGGTFTDCVSVDEAGVAHHQKVLSSKRDPSEGLMRGIEALAAASGQTTKSLLTSAGRLSHGTTIGTNIAVERNGSNVGLITTRGHRDALFMMRGTGRFADLSPEQIYNVQKTSMPIPLVSRHCVLEIDERVDRTGRVVVPLNEADIREEIQEFLSRTGISSVAICLLWSFRNDSHEQTVARIVRELAPGVFVSTSSSITPRLGEYERVVATVLNSYVGPFSTEYLNRTADRLTEDGLSGPFLVMQSNGGVVPAATASAMPLSLIGSGPAGGLVGSATLARAYGHKNVIATDMGGTSFDVGLIVDHEYVTADRRLLDKYTYIQPAIDIRSIACGGGSIARFDEHSRSMRVGPDSAGSEPGPACYGRGGTLPTVTDADVVLGFIRPTGFLGGSMPLSRDAAVAAVGALAQRLGKTLEETAAGIIRINNNNAATLIRQQTLERGYDTRNFAIYAFGGAGPLHAFGFGPELGVREILVPLGNGASTLSAYGIASSPIVQFFEKETRIRVPFNSSELTTVIASAEAAAFQGLRQSKLEPDETSLERFALMRYAEQRMHSLAIPIPPGDIDDQVCNSVMQAFDAEYSRQYGKAAKVLGQTAEIFAVRIRAVKQLSFPALNVTLTGEPPSSAEISRSRLEDRMVFWPNTMERIITAAYDGSRLPVGAVLHGPAIIELPHTSVVVAKGQSVKKDPLGSLTIIVDD